MAEAASVEQCVALLDYDAQFPDEISFRHGDILHVTHKGGHSGYWQGYVAYPASTSATVNAAMTLAEAGDDEGAARTMATLASGAAPDLPGGTAVWPAQAEFDEDETDSATEVSADVDTTPLPRAFDAPVTSAVGGHSPAVPQSGGASSSLPDGDRRRGRRNVIASFFSSLKGSKSRRRRGGNERASDGGSRTPPPTPGSAAARVTPSSPHSGPADAHGKRHGGRHVHGARTPVGSSVASAPNTRRATIGREGLFPNCVVSSNVAPDLALMRVFQQKCMALFPYKARDATEVSFDAEDVLTAVCPGPSPGWWYGYNVSALEPARRLARRLSGRRRVHSHTTPQPPTAAEKSTVGDRLPEPLSLDASFPWEETARGVAGDATPDRSSQTNPPLQLSPFLFSRCSQRFEDVTAGTDDERTPMRQPSAVQPQHTPTPSDHPLAARDDSECGASFVSTSNSMTSVHSTLAEPHTWAFLSALDPVTRAKVEARCGTLRKPLLFPTSYVTSDIVLTVFRFDRRQPHELSIDVGDVIRVHRRWNDGWWEGSLRGERGIFPSNYTIPNVPSLRDVPFGATGTTTSTLGDDEHDAEGTTAASSDVVGPLAAAMAAMTFPPTPHTPLSPHGAATRDLHGPAPIFFCPLCKTVLAVESRAEVMQSATTCRTCQQHEAITDAMLSALEAYVDTARATPLSDEDGGESGKGNESRHGSTSARLNLFATVPLFPADAAASTKGTVPSLLTNKDVADVSFGRVKFV